MSEEPVVIRWFKGENSDRVDGVMVYNVFAIYQAKFQGTTYLGELFWNIKNSTEWEKRSAVADWYFIGKDNIWEITEEEARAYLPEAAQTL